MMRKSKVGKICGRKTLGKDIMNSKAPSESE